MCIRDRTIVTKPKKPKDVVACNFDSDSCTINWSLPSAKEKDKHAHTFLKGVRIEIKSSPEGTYHETFCVGKATQTFVLTDLLPLMTYEITLASICSIKCGAEQEERTTESQPITHIFTTLMEPARNIRIEGFKDDSFTVKWDVKKSTAIDAKCSIFLVSCWEFRMAEIRGKSLVQLKEHRMVKQPDLYGGIFPIHSDQTMEYHFESLPPKGVVDRSAVAYLIGIKISGRSADGAKLKSKHIAKYVVSRPQPPSNLQVNAKWPEMIQVSVYMYYWFFFVIYITMLILNFTKHVYAFILTFPFDNNS